uniref:Uncharacterized protein n=1 Tax=Timema douglasi TaxID=61478 RepID=A0A7R8VGE0_TIMDO|nr:unnamed protein product [Timema douglasi]
MVLTRLSRPRYRHTNLKKNLEVPDIEFKTPLSVARSSDYYFTEAFGPGEVQEPPHTQLVQKGAQTEEPILQEASSFEMQTDARESRVIRPYSNLVRIRTKDIRGGHDACRRKVPSQIQPSSSLTQ